jgi:tRNA (cytidine/uridine-2'-O-)-methyltransferase
MIRLALYQPEIPPNTGNLIRLCANSGAQLHLIHPLGFDTDDRALRRAGLDYHEFATMVEHASWEAFRAALPQARLLAFSTRGRVRYDRVEYRGDDVLLFGPESRGLPAELLEGLPESQRIYLPMQPGNRSINLSNAAAIAVYEVWRQRDFAPGDTPPAIRPASPD